MLLDSRRASCIPAAFLLSAFCFLPSIGAPADKVVFINAEDNQPFDRAVHAMDAAHEGGALKIGSLTEAPK